MSSPIINSRLNRKSDIACGSIKANRGFTILEAIIGFLILSVGMLGIASLQAISLKSGKTAVYGSVATMKVEELFESMRANSTALTSYAGTGGGANNGCSGTTNCSPAALAAASEPPDLHGYRLSRCRACESPTPALPLSGLSKRYPWP